MTTMNNHSLADAFAARRRELEDELRRIEKAMAILGPNDTVAIVPPEPGRAPMAPRRKPRTMRDWIARTAKRQGTVTPDAVVAAAAERGREYNRKSIAVELSKMKGEGLLRKVFKGYEAAQA